MSEQSDAIFSRIANRYDLINRILSLGREQAWRESAARLLPAGRILDLGSGTGAAAPVFRSSEVVALDPVAPMLALSPIAAQGGRGRGATSLSRRRPSTGCFRPMSFET